MPRDHLQTETRITAEHCLPFASFRNPNITLGYRRARGFATSLGARVGGFGRHGFRFDVRSSMREAYGSRFDSVLLPSTPVLRLLSAPAPLLLALPCPRATPLPYSPATLLLQSSSIPPLPVTRSPLLTCPSVPLLPHRIPCHVDQRREAVGGHRASWGQQTADERRSIRS